jgi:hypothetical protein
MFAAFLPKFTRVDAEIMGIISEQSISRYTGPVLWSRARACGETRHPVQADLPLSRSALS